MLFLDRGHDHRSFPSTRVRAGTTRTGMSLARTKLSATLPSMNRPQTALSMRGDHDNGGVPFVGGSN